MDDGSQHPCIVNKSSQVLWRMTFAVRTVLIVREGRDGEREREREKEREREREEREREREFNNA